MTAIVFGLSFATILTLVVTPAQLALSGAVGGAVVGGGVDLLLGGASLFLGGAVGAAVGAASASV